MLWLVYVNVYVVNSKTKIIQVFPLRKLFKDLEVAFCG
jgi:hypothetical protein